jgi:hypothetical protein
MSIEEMVDTYNGDLVDSEEQMTVAEMNAQMRAKGLPISHKAIALAAIEMANDKLAYIDTSEALLVWNDEDIARLKAFNIDMREFWQKELDKCKPSDIQIATEANNLHYAIMHKLGTEAQRQEAIDQFIERVV